MHDVILLLKKYSSWLLNCCGIRGMKCADIGKPSTSGWQWAALHDRMIFFSYNRTPCCGYLLYFVQSAETGSSGKEWSKGATFLFEFRIFWRARSLKQTNVKQALTSAAFLLLWCGSASCCTNYSNLIKRRERMLTGKAIKKALMPTVTRSICEN